MGNVGEYISVVLATQTGVFVMVTISFFFISESNEKY